ncbi:MAG TPA: 50S ribosomal protein L11 methyltransferase [Mycobacteriales bacterium]|nr:50S ribosomal protein L11 methyltransferase [Mycobacteriales bacterium]
MRRTSPAEFVLAHTRVRRAPFVPEVTLHLADDSLELWEATQVAVERGDIPPPFWAFVWAGGQALARHVLDHDIVAGRDVVDIATGSGLVAVAAALSGAESVTAYDVDPMAVAATRANARLNNVTVDVREADVRDVVVRAGTLVTVGDVFYDERIAAAMLPALSAFVAAGAEVLVGDPHRAYLPDTRLDPLATYDVDVETDIEDAPVKTTVVARFLRTTPQAVS